MRNLGTDATSHDPRHPLKRPGTAARRGRAAA